MLAVVPDPTMLSRQPELPGPQVRRPKNQLERFTLLWLQQNRKRSPKDSFSPLIAKRSSN
jgi:hypothetical protein